MNKHQLLKFRFSILLPIIFLGGCMVFQSQPEGEVYEDRTRKAENKIQNYISAELFPSQNTYKPYRFYTLTLLKHPEVKRLNRYFKRKKKIEDNKRKLKGAYSDSLKNISRLIEEQKDSVENNNWQSRYEMTHMFSITERGKEKNIYEYTFTLNFQLDSVIDVEPILEATEPKVIRGVFYHFFSEKALSGREKADEDFYRFYKKYLSSIEGSISRGAFLEHCMEVTAVAASKNSVSLDDLSKGMIQSFIKKDTLFKDAFILDYGEFYETLDSTGGKKKVLEYDRNVLFTIPNDSTAKKDSLGMQFVFDPYLRINDIYTIPPPYDEIF